jgi:hypothetical protein
MRKQIATQSTIGDLPAGFISPTPEEPEVLVAILPESTFDLIAPGNREMYMPLCFTRRGEYIAQPLEVRYGKFIQRRDAHFVELRIPKTDRWLPIRWGDRTLEKTFLVMTDEVKRALIRQIPDLDLRDQVLYFHNMEMAKKEEEINFQ